MQITVQTIPHEEQRYNTLGDWQFDAQGNLDIFVSKMPQPKMEWCLALHEMVEALLCKARGISTETVDAWDMGPGALFEEPGDIASCPYHEEHKAAFNMEFDFADYLPGFDWDEYNDACAEVMATYPIPPTEDEEIPFP